MTDPDGELWPTDRVARWLGIAESSARKQLSKPRRNVQAHSRQRGRKGRNLYRPADIFAAFPKRAAELTHEQEET